MVPGRLLLAARGPVCKGRTRRPPRKGADMFTSTSRKVATLLTALAVLAAVTGIAQAATSKPAGMSRAEYRALIIRGDAMNEKYRLGRWQNVPQGMTPAEYRALTIRGEALNKQYHLGKWSTAELDLCHGRLPRVLVGSLRDRRGRDARARPARRRRRRRQPARPRDPARPHLVAAPTGNHRPRLSLIGPGAMPCLRAVVATLPGLDRPLGRSRVLPRGGLGKRSRVRRRTT